MQSFKKYDYVIVGGGICGCSIAFELSKISSSVLLIDKLDNVSKGASGAAGAFLSPLLGKPNKFKDLVNEALIYSTNFYKQNTPELIDNCGTVRVPKDRLDEDKFQSYIPFIDFHFEVDIKTKGYFFPIGSVVNSSEICKILSKNAEQLFNYDVVSIDFVDECWVVNKEILAKNLILSTGASIKLLDEAYIEIRSVWGQRIDIETSTLISTNYHKECSIAHTTKINDTTYKSSIGATHHRFVDEKDTNNEDTLRLLKKANDILTLDNVKVTKLFGGARASSSDYFPMIGEIVDSKKTLEEFPYLKNGTNVNPQRFTRYKNLYIYNGVGGRGFVFAPYLAKILVKHIVKENNIDDTLSLDRLFKRWVKR